MESTKLLQHQCGAVLIMNGALQYLPHTDNHTTMSISFNGQERIKGKATQFISLSLVSGVIACRSLLEFLGIKYNNKQQTLVLRSGSRKDDICIEKFQDVNGRSLEKVKPSIAIQFSTNPPQTEESLKLIINTANKKLAHLTTSNVIKLTDHKLLSLAGIVTLGLMDTYFYSLLGEQSSLLQTTNTTGKTSAQRK